MFAIALVMAMVGIPPAAMREVVADRLARLDRLVVHTTFTAHLVPRGTPALQLDAWRRVDGPHDLVVKLVRPALRCDWLTNDPAAGYEPVTEFADPTGFVREYRLPDPHGRRHFTMVIGQGPEHGLFDFLPVLQFLDLHIQDSRVAFLNVLRLFDEFEVREVDETPDGTTYECDVPMGNVEHHYRFTLTPRGMPTCWRTVVAPLNSGQPWVREAFVLGTCDLAGAEFPVDVVMSISNPNIPGLSEDTVVQFSVTAATVDDTIGLDDIAIPVATRESSVTTIRPDGVYERRVYGPTGELVGSSDTFGPAPLEQTLAAGHPARGHWRVAIQSVGLLACAAAAFGAVRARRAA